MALFILYLFSCLSIFITINSYPFLLVLWSELLYIWYFSSDYELHFCFAECLWGFVPLDSTYYDAEVWIFLFSVFL